MNQNNFEPKIIAFCCHCERIHPRTCQVHATISTNIRIIEHPTGKLEVEYFTRAFENGADGVLVAGCEEGSCHFSTTLWRNVR
jgi:coenzyme F420-reducing hydrogenase delta subunit